jgi:hypothetical protein
MSGKGSGHVQAFWPEKDLETLVNSIIERFGVAPIVLHILVIDRRVLRIKT